MTQPLTIIGREILYKGEPVGLLFNEKTVCPSMRADVESVIRDAYEDRDDGITEAYKRYMCDLHEFLRSILLLMEISVDESIFKSYETIYEDEILLFDTFKEFVEKRLEEIKQEIAILKTQIDGRI